MNRTTSGFLAIVIAAGLLDWALHHRSELAPPEEVAHVASSTPAVLSAVSRVVPAAQASTPAGFAPGAEQVAGWIADTRGEDPDKRAAAIRALAEAPRVTALPALKYVLVSGEPRVDRPLALQSLAALALRDGDADGAVREILRSAIYHGDELTQQARQTLDDVEQRLAAKPAA